MKTSHLVLSALVIGLTLLVPAPASAQVTDTTQTDDALLREIEAELAASQPTPPPVVRTAPSTNPDISLIADVRAGAFSQGRRKVDLGVEEIETSFRSVVDPYARADVFLSIAQGEEGFEFELEEAYLTTLSLPAQLQLRAGKFRSNFGRINRTHPHALPFIDAPAMYENFFGEEGLNDQGVSLSWLVPNRSFYQELTLEVTRGPHENASFETSEGNRLMYTARAKNFWDLTPNATLELGLSGILGPNPSGRTTTIAAMDLTYKWKPLRFNTYKAFTLQAEGLWSRNALDTGSLDTWGWYALAGYQFARRLAANIRFDQSDLPTDADWNQTGLSATLGMYLTEFQKLELGLRRTTARDLDAEYSALFRVIFVIGTHGAHEY